MSAYNMGVMASPLLPAPNILMEKDATNLPAPNSPGIEQHQCLHSSPSSGLSSCHHHHHHHHHPSSSSTETHHTSLVPSVTLNCAQPVSLECESTSPIGHHSRSAGDNRYSNGDISGTVLVTSDVHMERPPLNSRASLEQRRERSTSSHAGNPDPAAAAASSATKPMLLAGKYVIAHHNESATFPAHNRFTNEPYHIRTTSVAAAHSLVAKHSLLGDQEGIRPLHQLIVAEDHSRAWLAFPAHCGDLHNHVRNHKRLREPEAQRLFAQVARTVAHCHDSGLVLRDLKLRKFVFATPEKQNLVLECLEDTMLVGDDDLLQDKHGCPAYVAPEILMSDRYSGRAADMWGLGVMLFTMLLGRYPFHDSDTSVLFAKIRKGSYAIPAWVSSRARHLITCLLHQNPHKRLTAREVLTHPWLTHAPRDHTPRSSNDHCVPHVDDIPSQYDSCMSDDKDESPNSGRNVRDKPAVFGLSAPL